MEKIERDVRNFELKLIEKTVITKDLTQKSKVFDNLKQKCSNALMKELMTQDVLSKIQTEVNDCKKADKVIKADEIAQKTKFYDISVDKVSNIADRVYNFKAYTDQKKETAGKTEDISNKENVEVT